MNKYIDAIKDAIENCQCVYGNSDGLLQGTSVNEKEVDKALSLFWEFIKELGKRHDYALREATFFERNNAPNAAEKYKLVLKTLNEILEMEIPNV